MTKYLKKPDAPDWDYHIWTPYLEARGDMVPYEPPPKAEVQEITPVVPLEEVVTAEVVKAPPKKRLIKRRVK